MSNLLSFLRDPRFIAAFVVILTGVVVSMTAQNLKTALIWMAIIGTLIGASLLVYYLFKRHRAAHASDNLNAMLDEQASKAVEAAPDARQEEIHQLRNRMQEAIKTIRTSKLGETSGRAALYELPWYMVIGNPAAGKSSAVKNSGLKFPFSDQNGAAVHGIGGTRNCDWFFTTEGILLDTAGRYSVHDEDRTEWIGFLELLKKHRPRAPINGIVIAVSIAELTQNKPEFTINLAKSLRQRVQELTETLCVFVPVYVVFTKMDLLAGFVDFFENSETQEQERVWGATLPYDAEQKFDASGRFDEQFEHLYDGLKELSIARMAMNRSQALSPGLMTFPMEFHAIRPVLRTFIATLFEDNPFQFKPVFRGFYFTSALQEGVAVSPLSARMADRFSLGTPASKAETRLTASHGLFLKDLFSKVIFADKHLVRQYASRHQRRLRLGVFFGAFALLGLMLGAWTWSYLGNQEMARNVRADLDKIVKLQQARNDLGTQLESLEILQDRIEQLQRYREDTPMSLSFGLYHGDELEAKLRKEYFNGIRNVLLNPISGSLEGFLTEVNTNAGNLRPLQQPMQAAAAPAKTTMYKDASPTNVEDAYNALKAYIMLGSRDRLEPGHLNDQITRFWRTWLENNRGTLSREQMIRSAEKILTYLLTQTASPDFPLIENKLALVDQTRDSLRKVVKGMPARERVYAEIKMRASTRFPAITVANIVGEENRNIVAGSYVISGTFTRAAWDQYVEQAINDAATKDVTTSDWVLKTDVRDDLTLEGSPEQIKKTLVTMYKNEYAQEWKKFLTGISILDMGDFASAVEKMNRLGDPSLSPLYKVIETTYQETSWDNPSMLSQSISNAQKGVWASIKDWFSSKPPVPVNVTVGGTSQGGALQMGPIGKEFSVLSHLMVARGENRDASLMKNYLGLLGKLRSRFNELKNAGDVGPGSMKLMQQTLEGSGSELSDALRFVDEQMLNGVPDTAKATVRPMLVRPLMQAFGVLIKPAETELNKTWVAQVYEPFSKGLSAKYPFADKSQVEATPQEIAQLFGTDGAIAKFVDKTLGGLVVRRGDALTPRTWADMGISFNPEFVSTFPRYVAPVAGGGNAAAASAAAPAGPPQTRFQIMPIPTPGLSEYTFEIDGQQLRYRNGAQEWHNFVWPNPSGSPGVKINAITFDGRNVEVLNIPGQAGLEKMISSAQRKRRDQGVFDLSWSNGNVAVTVGFRLISSAQADASGNIQQGQGLKGLKLPTTIAGTGA
ncbi:type VI secretion system protein ImpL [Chitinivorax tropicus]|uniref:Type VI secretion system protein ImpL n=1 Tax=Chitinivorax tropicus TaxID=714531 RepID=A0A840MNH9_9PROT|nr:type VI secretion system membrane subunit TssM [Chitinivorax tropicus]MBB5017723.1 type VI secretion system protein ImpL [Chitinivorax tropicus]